MERGQIHKYVRYLHKPIKGTPIKEPQDVNETNNSILMNYHILYHSLTRQQIRAQFDDLSRLEDELSRAQPKVLNVCKWPQGVVAPNEALYGIFLNDLASAVENEYGFAVCYENKFLAAKKRNAEMKFRDGTRTTYAHLFHEHAANASILDCAFAFPKTGQIFVRDSSMCYLLALNDVLGYHKGLTRRDLEAVSIAHEIAELAYAKSGRKPQEHLEGELACERSALRFLTKHKSANGYETFHRLRASTENVSRHVLNSLVGFHA